MHFLQTAIAFIVALGVLVTIHEFGHYWVARKFNVKVLRFSVGFGKPIWSRVDKHGTEFCVAAIPLGGYVKMLDAREAEVPEHLLDQEFSQKPVMQRIAVFAAGPLVNLIFAVMVYWFLYMYGVTGLAPVVGHVTPDSPAALAGLQSGDEIVEVDGKPVLDWEGVTYSLVERIGDTGEIQLKIQAKETGYTETLDLYIDGYLKAQSIDSPLGALGVSIYEPKFPPVIGGLVAGGAAERDGLLPGDKVLSVDGQRIENWMEWVEVVRLNPERVLEVLVERDAEQVTLAIEPAAVVQENDEVFGQIGASVATYTDPSLVRMIQFGVYDAFFQAIAKTQQLINMTLSAIWKMIVGLISVENLSGPITIAQIAGDTAGYGMEPFLNFVAYLSISLGVLNLLPIPVLDGGHILFAVFELARGKPLSERIQQMGLSFGLAVLAMFMLVAFYNDVVRLAQ